MKSVVCFQPTYWPDLHYLHRMSFADVIVVMDGVQFRRRQLHHHRAVLPEGMLTVPIRHAHQRQTFLDLQCEMNGWQSEHIRTLQRLYPASTYFLGDAIGVIANFPVRFCDGIQKVYELILTMLPPTHMRTLVWQTDLPIHEHVQGEELLVELCRAVGGTHYLVGENAVKGYLKGAGLFDAMGIKLIRQNIEFPPYTDESRETWNWSFLDLIASLGPVNFENYLRNVEPLGWERNGVSS